MRRPSASAAAWRVFTAVSALLIVSSCAAASVRDATPTATDRLRVVADFSILSDFADAVGGARIDTHSVVPVGGDPHAYEPRPGDAAHLADADLVLEHGLALSPWMDSLRANAGTTIVTVGSAVAERTLGEGAGLTDPHLWMSPELAIHYVEVIATALVDADPANASDYRSNASDYRATLIELDAELQAAFASIPEDQRKLVTPHDAYGHFADHFGLEVLGTLVGVTTEEEPSAHRVRELVDAVRASDVPAVFVESTVPPRQIERVARDAGVELAGPLYGDSPGPPGSDADDYLGMMRSNAATIVEALGGEWP